MILYEDECVGCGLHCLGQSCPNKNVAHLVCDECGYDDDIYDFDGQHLCADCILSKFKKITIGDVL